MYPFLTQHRAGSNSFTETDLLKKLVSGYCSFTPN